MADGMWIDFTPKEEQVPEFIPEGWYTATIVSVEKKRSQTSGRYYYHWQFDPVGVHIDFRLWCVTLPNSGVEAATKYFADLVEAVRGERPMSQMYFNPSEYIGRSLKVEVGVAIYRGREGNNIVGFARSEVNAS